MRLHGVLHARDPLGQGSETADPELHLEFGVARTAKLALRLLGAENEGPSFAWSYFFVDLVLLAQPMVADDVAAVDVEGDPDVSAGYLGLLGADEDGLVEAELAIHRRLLAFARQLDVLQAGRRLRRATRSAHELLQQNKI